MGVKNTIHPILDSLICPSIQLKPTTQPQTLGLIRHPMPTPRDGLAIAVFKGKIYCFGGRNVSKDYSISTNVNEVYDIETDSWETETPMPTARSGLQASEVDDKIYLIGGRIESESSSISEKSAQVEIYDPVIDTWTFGSPIPTAVAGYASAVLDGKIYVISGVAGCSTYTNLIQIYDPKKDEWSFGPPIPMSVTAAAAGATTGIKQQRLSTLLAEAMLPIHLMLNLQIRSIFLKLIHGLWLLPCRSIEQGQLRQ